MEKRTAGAGNRFQGCAAEHDKVQLSYSDPSWRGLVLFFRPVFPGGSGLIHTPREKRRNRDILPILRGASDNSS